MLYITFGDPEDIEEPMVFNCENYFRSACKDSWFSNDISKQIAKDIDNTELVSPNLAISNVLGPINPYKMSSGALMLIIMANTDKDLLYCGEMMGDNCNQWLIDISKNKDIRITIGGNKDFCGVTGFEATVTNSGKKLDSVRDYDKAWLEWADTWND